MSTIDATCYTIPPEIESGAGERKCFNKSINYEDSNSKANVVASEIVNDILEAALDIVMERNNNDKHSRYFEKISSNVVGDILNNILTTSSANETAYAKNDETSLLDDEIKRMIKEMKCPTEEKSPICTKGVGDQLCDKKEIPSDKILTEPKRNTLERKNRLTNLVKNSKLMLSKFIVVNDSREKELDAEQDIQDERIVKVVNLEYPEYSSRCDLNGEIETKTEFPRDSSLDLVNLETKINDSNCEACCSKDLLDEGKKAKGNRRRWNIGAKIMRLIRRQPNKKEKEVLED